MLMVRRDNLGYVDWHAHGHLWDNEHVVGGQYLPDLFGQCDEP